MIPDTSHSILSPTYAPPDRGTTVLPVAFISSSVKTWVRQSRLAGDVHSIFRQCCNIVFDNDRLLTLHASHLGLIPFGIAVDVPLSFDFRIGGLTPCMDAHLTPTGIDVGSGQLTAFYGGAPSVSPRLAVEGLGAVPYAPPERLSRARDILLAEGGADGFAALLREACWERPWGAGEDVVSRRASEALRMVLDGTIREDRARTTRGVHRLSGLGPGLTPSGDDALVGVLAVATVLGCSRPLAAVVADHARKRQTTRVAAAFLKAAARGCFAGTVSGFVRALCGSSEENLIKAAAVLAATGHSSGVDTGLGVLAAWSVLAQHHQGRP